MSEQEAFEQAITKHIVSNKLKAFALEKLPNGTYKNNFTKAKLDGWQYATTEANKRIEALESEVAAFEAISFVQMKQIDELQANNHDLREALEKLIDEHRQVIDDEHGCEPDSEDYINAVKALSTTPAESLQAFENEVIEKCAPDTNDWNEKRMDVIGQNGNDGDHY